MLQKNVKVVLVRPAKAGNIGAAARVMCSLGFRHLVLVAPEADPADRQAREMAVHGESLLDQAVIVPDLAAAVADCVLAVGTTARTAGLYRGQMLSPVREAAGDIIATAAQGPVAVVFGPEDRGLTNEEIGFCHRLVTVPTEAAYPTLNLAQAVAICLYELRLAWLGPAGQPAGRERPALADGALRQRAFERLRAALARIGFLSPQNPDHLMFALRHLCDRAGLSVTEAQILIGLAQQIQAFADRRDRIGPEEAPASPKEA